MVFALLLCASSALPSTRQLDALQGELDEIKTEIQAKLKAQQHAEPPAHHPAAALKRSLRRLMDTYDGDHDHKLGAEELAKAIGAGALLPRGVAAQVEADAHSNAHAAAGLGLERRVNGEVKILALTYNVDGDTVKQSCSDPEEMAKKICSEEGQKVKEHGIISRAQWIRTRLAQIALDRPDADRPDVVYLAIEEPPKGSEEPKDFLTMEAQPDNVWNDYVTEVPDTWQNWEKQFLEKYEPMETAWTSNSRAARRVAVAAWRKKGVNIVVPNSGMLHGKKVRAQKANPQEPLVLEGDPEPPPKYADEKKPLLEREIIHNTQGVGPIQYDTKATLSVQCSVTVPGAGPVYITFSGSHLDAYDPSKAIESINNVVGPLDLSTMAGKAVSGKADYVWDASGEADFEERPEVTHVHVWGGDFNPRMVFKKTSVDEWKNFDSLFGEDFKKNNDKNLAEMVKMDQEGDLPLGEKDGGPDFAKQVFEQVQEKGGLTGSITVGEIGYDYLDFLDGKRAGLGGEPAIATVFAKEKPAVAEQETPVTGATSTYYLTDTTYIEGPVTFKPSYPNPPVYNSEKPRINGYADRIFARMFSMQPGKLPSGGVTMEIAEYAALDEDLERATDSRPGFPEKHPPRTKGDHNDEEWGDHKPVYSLIKIKNIPKGSWDGTKMEALDGPGTTITEWMWKPAAWYAA